LPPPAAAPFPPFDLSASQDFAVLGYSIAYDYVGLTIGSSAPVSLNEAIALRYNGLTRGYEAELPGFAPGRLVLNNSTGGRGYTVTNGIGSNVLQSLFVNFFSGEIARDDTGLGQPTVLLISSNFASWSGSPSNSRDVFGHFAFGIPTLQSAIPPTGVRTYRTVARGLTEVFPSGPTGADFHFLIGSGSLQLNFDARTTGGTISIGSDELGREDNFGTFTLTGGPVAADGRFAGSILVPGEVGPGSFEGRLTGPDASEVIVRWRMPLRIPSAGRTTQAYGIWVGKAG
jgi:hypothetical protein